MPRSCLVLGCPYKYFRQPGMMIHKFPKESAIRKTWCCRMGIEIQDVRIGTGGNCSHHFSDRSYKGANIAEDEGNRRLLKYAIPDAHLPIHNNRGKNNKTH